MILKRNSAIVKQGNKPTKTGDKQVIPNETLDALTNGRKGFYYTEDGEFAGAGGVDAMNLLRLHSLYSALKLETKTNMKISRKVNTLKVANQMLNTNYKRKEKALEHIEAILKMAGELK